MEDGKSFATDYTDFADYEKEKRILAAGGAEDEGRKMKGLLYSGVGANYKDFDADYAD